MISYAPVLSEEHGRELSRALWHLASPPATRQIDAKTTHYCGVEQDIHGQWWLELPDDFNLPVSSLADAALFDAVVAEIEKMEDAP